MNCRTLLLAIIATLALVPAHADTDDLSGGVLLVHAPPGLVYSSGMTTWCDSTKLEDCEDQITSLDTDSSAVAIWFILSAWEEEKSFSAVEFGLGDFDPESFGFVDYGICLDGAMALPHGDWPGPNTGIAIAASGDAWTGQLVPIYWFAGLNYAEADTIAITENPATGHAGWLSGVSDSVYDAECLGVMGLGMDGMACCSREVLDGETAEQGSEDWGSLETDGATEQGDEELLGTEDGPRPDGTGWVDLGDEPDPFRLQLGASNGSSTILEMTLDGFFAEPVEIDGKTHYQLSLPGESVSTEGGLPELPTVSRSLLIPNTALMGVRVLSATHLDLPTYPVAPSKGDLAMSVDPASIPFYFDSLYQGNALYPTNVVDLGRPYIFRDYRGIVVTLHPLQANPASDTLRVYTHLTIEVFTDGIDTVNTITTGPPPFVDRQFSLLYSHLFINYASSASLLHDLPTQDGGLLIIANDSYEAQLSPLIQWREAKGLTVECKTISEVCGAMPNATDIANCIRDAYLDDHISYVLLVGDSADVPAPQIAAPFPLNYTYLSDPTYALIEGDDMRPEIFIGRFSAQLSCHVTTQVERTVEYERDLPTDAPFLRNVFCMSTNHCSSPYGRAFFANDFMEERAYTLDSLGYEVARLYNPPGGGPTDVANVINPGIGLMLAHDHGWWDHWDMDFPAFTVENVGVLENANMLPVIYACSCRLGMFSHEMCFAEAWLWSRREGEPIGAVAAYMGSHDLSGSSSWALKGAMEFLMTEDALALGTLLYGGAMYFLDRVPDNYYQSFKRWHIFGDPSLAYKRNEAPVVRVDLGGGGDFATIGEAIANVASGTHILLPSGEIAGPGNAGLTCNEDKYIRLMNSTYGARPLIHCDGANGFIVMTNDNSELALVGVGIYGAGEDVVWSAGNVVCDNCSFNDNHGNHVIRSGKQLECWRCAFTENECGSTMIECDDGRFEQCVWWGNAVERSLVLCDSSLEMLKCTAADNDLDNGFALDLGDECVAEIGHTIIAFNRGRSVFCSPYLPHGLTTRLVCADLYGNRFLGQDGDWEYNGSGIAGQLGVDGNICENPYFCCRPSGDLGLYLGSACYGGECGRRGAGGENGPNGYGQEEDTCSMLLCEEASVGEAAVTNDGLQIEHRFLARRSEGVRFVVRWGGVGVDEDVDIAIVDVTGRVVRGLGPSPLLGGQVMVEWDGRDASGGVAGAGVYLVRVRAAGVNRVCKIILVD